MLQTLEPVAPGRGMLAESHKSNLISQLQAFQYGSCIQAEYLEASLFDSAGFRHKYAFLPALKEWHREARISYPILTLQTWKFLPNA